MAVTSRFENVHNLEESSHSDGRVHDLPHDGGVKASVETLYAALCVELFGDLNETCFPAGLSFELLADLDQVHGLDAACGCDTCESSY